MDFSHPTPSFPHNVNSESALLMALSHFRNGYLSGAVGHDATSTDLKIINLPLYMSIKQICETYAG